MAERYELRVTAEVPDMQAAADVVRFYADGLRIHELFRQFQVDFSDTRSGLGTAVYERPSGAQEMGFYVKITGEWEGDNPHENGLPLITDALEATFDRLGIKGRIIETGVGR